MTKPVIADTPFVRPDVAAFLGYLNNLPGPRTHEMAVADARAAMLAMCDVADPPRGELAVVRDLTIPGPAGALSARLFDARAERAAGPAIVFFHGGGWVIGSVDSHASLAAEMARQLDLPVISVDYRLAPEAPFPAAVEDAEAAARWVAESPAALERAVTGLVLTGDSAGGNLTIVTSMALRDRPAAVPVLVQAPLYPATDATRPYSSLDAFADGYLLTREAMGWFGDHYRPDAHDARFSPLIGDATALPPAVIVAAGLDPLRDQARAYAAALALAGVPVAYQEARGNIHGFATLRRAIPSSQQDLAAFLTAVRTAVASAARAIENAKAAG
ncbi:alpha/beta hydrolase [Sphingomonas sp. 8AM]|uniref:alpha/beta hydrolase n=1 Tax=Sphingomonas sp. 8AM TaxID=2653170 RepID=UPI0012F056E4|nr:alpha/beta hydrolase [Sphingomonas sp. 8AM]VXD03138.1 Lipase [Sphingomonas sp. 8AM]